LLVNGRVSSGCPTFLISRSAMAIPPLVGDRIRQASQVPLSGVNVAVDRGVTSTSKTP
jgi:hypothetical protein